MRHEWVENVRRQSEASGVAFFFTQWGAWADGRGRAKKANGRVLNGRTWFETPGRWVWA